MPVCGNYLFFELPKKIVLNPKDGGRRTTKSRFFLIKMIILKNFLIKMCSQNDQIVIKYYYTKSGDVITPLRSPCGFSYP